MNGYNQDNNDNHDNNDSNYNRAINTGDSGENRAPDARETGHIYPPVQGGNAPSGGQYSLDNYRKENPSRSGKDTPGGRGSYYYNPGEGWRRDTPSSARGQKYEWNFRDYDELAGRSKSRKRRRGPVVFAICLLSFIVICAAVSAGYSYMTAPGGGITAEGEASESVSQVVPGIAGAQSDPKEGIQLELSSKPEVSESSTQGGRLSIPQIAKLVTPSVVGVSAFQGSRYYDPVSMGSGIIMSEDGYIVTNAHVVMGATKFKVQLHDNSPYDAVLIGSDASTDLAILKIDAKGLAAAGFGNSDEIEVGEMVVAIGNPSGSDLAGSVTFGIVSAVNRKVSTGNYSFKYIQTDAAINPGNSGGALVNEFGQVIGINSSKIVATGYEGIGFAIPVTDAKPILDDIMVHGKVTGRVMLGITCIPVGDVDAKNFGIPPGLEIQEIYPHSDIANHDVQSGDILTHIDNQPVYSLSDVQGILQGHKAGDRVTLRFFRRVTTVDDIEFEITVRLIEN